MNLQKKKFGEIDINDPFFDTLKKDYPEFEEWFRAKSTAGWEAYVLYDATGKLIDFLYLKLENEVIAGNPELPAKSRLKVGTFKIFSRHTIRGERFIKKIMDTAIQKKVEEIYVTVFDDTSEKRALIKLFSTFGFEKKSELKHDNGKIEHILVKEMNKFHDDILKDYPKIDVKKDKYVLSIYPEFHTKLFPDSILNNENYDVINDISITNCIRKMYICKMFSAHELKTGDLIVIYRTSDKLGPADYRSVITSICTVEEIKTKDDFRSYEDFKNYVGSRSVFSEAKLTELYGNRNMICIKMLYNVALSKRVIRKDLIEKIGIGRNEYWGFFKLTDQQFEDIFDLGNAAEEYKINE